MAIDKFVTVAVAGDPKHGKTSLVCCITGIDRDSHEESHSGSCSSQMHFAFCQPSLGVRIALVDMPNQSDLPRTTGGSLNSADLAVLVVAADDGIMPQTKDHLEVLNRFNVQGGLFVITKADLVDNETIQLAQMEIDEISKGSCLEGKPIIPFSAVDKRGLDQILEAMEYEADRVDGCGYFTTAHYKFLKKQVLSTVTDILVNNVFRAAVSPSELCCRLKPLPNEWLLERILRELCSSGRTICVNGGYRIPTLPVRLPANQERVAGQMLEYMHTLGYVAVNAPIFCDLHWKGFNVGEIRRTLEYLYRREKLVRLNDGRYLTCQAMKDIKEKVIQVIAHKGGVTVQDGKEILGYGRMRVIPVLEYLDSIGLTCRMDDVRVLAAENGLMQGSIG